jgi:hypothetical protein
MKKSFLAAVLAGSLMLVGSASPASSPYSLMGTATTNADGSVQLNSANSGVSLAIPSNTSVGDLDAFLTDFNLASGCGAGVPQLAIITVKGTIRVPLSNAARFSCGTGTQNSGNLLGFDSPVDTGEILGGTFADTWGHAKSEYDNLQVLAVELITTAAQSATVSNFVLSISIDDTSPSM